MTTHNLCYGGLLALLLITVQPVSAQPSFDCNKAQSWAEKTLCGDDHLAALDSRLAELFSEVRGTLDGTDREQLITTQRAWLREREQCWQAPDQSPEACLAAAYRQRMGQLQDQLSPPSVAAVSVLAECEQVAASRPELTPCLLEKLDQASLRLAQAVEASADEAHSLDTVINSDAFGQFDASQEQFYQYRDAACSWLRTMMAGGTGSEDSYRACLVDLTRERAALLERALP